MSKDAIRQVLEELSSEYRAGLGLRMRTIDDLWSVAQSASTPPEALRRALHSIAGSAATFGLPDVTATARAAEECLDACCERGEPLPPDARAEFEALLQALQNAATAKESP